MQEGSYLFILEVLFAGDGRSVADVTEGCSGGIRRSARLDSGARQHLVLLHCTAQQVRRGLKQIQKIICENLVEIFDSNKVS